MKKTLAFALLLSILSNTCIINANESHFYKTDIDGNTFPDEFESFRQYENAPDYYTKEHQKQLATKIEESENYLQNKKLTRSGGGTKKLDVPLHYQIREYYCAPAVAEMIIDYKLGRGKSPNQETLADEGKDLAHSVNLKTWALGYTNVGDLTTVLRKYTKANYQTQNVNDYALGNALVTDIDANYPLALNPRTKRFSEYKGANLQHFQVANGYSYEFSGSSGYSKLYYLDSYKNSQYPKAYGRHSIKTDIMQSALKDNYGLYIW